MALHEDNLERKKEDVRRHFAKLASTKELGVAKFSQEYCLCKTAQKFYLAPATIQKYVYSAENALL